MASSARFAQLGLAAVLLVFLASITVLAVGAMGRNQQRSQISIAPGFVLQDLDGNQVSLASLRGHVAVLIFGSSRDAACNDYNDRIARLSRECQSDHVRILSIETPTHGRGMAGVDELRVYRSVTGQRFPVLLDRSAEVAASYGVVSLPTVCVIDEDGIVRYRGAFDDNRREDMVKNHYCRDAIQRLSRTEVTAAAFYTGLR